MLSGVGYLQNYLTGLIIRVKLSLSTPPSVPVVTLIWAALQGGLDPNKISDLGPDFGIIVREVREKERGAHNKEGQSVSGERPLSEKSHSQAGELAKRLFGYNGYERPSKAEPSCSPEAGSCAT